jgi:endonuclease/exonuclease/phosphatase family metal-dependent hydrolase
MVDGKSARVREPTRYPVPAFRTYPTRFPSLAVDYIFVNAALHPTHLRVDRTPLARLASDHFPLVCELTLI